MLSPSVANLQFSNVFVNLLINGYTMVLVWYVFVDLFYHQSYSVSFRWNTAAKAIRQQKKTLKLSEDLDIQMVRPLALTII